MKISFRGFTIIELLVVIAIIGLLTTIVVPSVRSVRSSGRDAQVRSDKQLIILALVKAREDQPDYLYPGTAGVYSCLKSGAASTCWRGGAQGHVALYNAITPYLPGNIVPVPPGTQSGEYRHDAYVFNPGPVSPNAGIPSGAYLIWPQEKPISNSDCNGWNAGQIETGLYYCYERLPD